MINTIYPTTEKFCADYISDEEPEFSINITPKDIEFEKNKFIQEAQAEGGACLEHPDAYLELIALQRKVTEALFERDILLFHGSAIAVDGTAYLFTATSGTGKSTHTRLWREMLGNRAVMVNDDKPFISMRGDEIIVHGSPWNGKHKLGENISVPLRAICILERGETNEIAPISASSALKMLLQQSSRPQNVALIPKYMELLDSISRGVAFYRLKCNMDPEAARVSFEGMSKEN